jgi:cytochrome c556
MMRTIALLSMTLGIVIGYVGLALADPLDDAIKARQSFMQIVAFNAGPLFDMAGGKASYDATKAQISANNLKALASMHNDAMWPKGSDNIAKKGKTRAMPSLWKDGSEFGGHWKSWQAAVDDLAAAAGGGLDALKPKVAAMGKACGGCHKAYRAKDF